MNHAKLPAGYRFAGVMDFVHNRKLMLRVNIAALISIPVLIILGLIFVPFGPSWQLMTDHWLLFVALGLMYIAYIFLHEITHGVFMGLLSGAKVNYGFQFCYAYAGSTAWFDRKSHIITALAPLVIWGIVLQALCMLLPPEWFWLFWPIQISNISGSAGDIYCSVYLTRFPGDILIQDTGTRMRIMRKAPPGMTPIRQTNGRSTIQLEEQKP